MPRQIPVDGFDLHIRGICVILYPSVREDGGAQISKGSETLAPCGCIRCVAPAARRGEALSKAWSVRIHGEYLLLS